MKTNAVGDARPECVVPVVVNFSTQKHGAHEHIGCLRMGFHGNKDDYLKKPPFYSSKKSFGKSPTFPTPIP